MSPHVSRVTMTAKQIAQAFGHVQSTTWPPEQPQIYVAVTPPACVLHLHIHLQCVSFVSKILCYMCVLMIYNSIDQMFSTEAQTFLVEQQGRLVLIALGCSEIHTAIVDHLEHNSLKTLLLEAGYYREICCIKSCTNIFSQSRQIIQIYLLCIFFLNKTLSELCSRWLSSSPWY